MGQIMKPTWRHRDARAVGLILVAVLLMQSFSTAASMQQDGIQQRQLLQGIRDIEAAMNGSNWSQAASLFDATWSQICEGEDPLLTNIAGDTAPLRPGQSEILAGGRARLENVFLNRDGAFRTEYRRQFSSVAEQALKDAIAFGGETGLEHVAARYRFLAAGEAATRLLARLSLERGEYLDATLRLERLRRLTDSPSDSDAGRTLRLQMATAAWRAGMSTDAVNELRSLIEQGAEVVVLGGREVILPKANADSPQTDAALEAWLTQTAGPASGMPQVAASGAVLQPQWTQMLGNYRRAALQAAGPVNLQTRWESSLFEVSDFLFADRMNPLLIEARDLVRQFAVGRLAENSTVTPVAVPLVIGDRLIVRTVAGLRAFYAATGELAWEATLPDGRLRSAIDAAVAAKEQQETDTEPFVDSPNGIQIVPGNGRRFPMTGRLNSVDALTQSLALNLFFERVRTNTAEQLASNGETVFAVEDSAWVTWNSEFDSVASNSTRLPANYLRAYDAVTGVCRWEAGGQRTSQTKANTLAGFYFLGAPLILGSRVYVLAESPEGVFLLQLGEPEFRNSSPESANPRVLHSQLLAVPQFPLDSHPVRKFAGLVPSYAQGLLICPTCDEHVVAISAEDHSMRWAYRYGGTVRMPDLGQQTPVLSGSLNSMHSERVDLNSRWTDALPRIVGNRVLYSPRDADELFCLDLQTGRELWRTARGLGRSIAAVTDDYVVVTGNKLLMTVSIETGELVWTQEIREGSISGAAASDGMIIHVPTSVPSIITFELATGRHLLTRRVKSTEPVGNLLFLDDMIVSQGLTTISCFGQGETDGESARLVAAERMLLNGQFSGAVEVLNAEVSRLSATPAQGDAASLEQKLLAESARTLLIDVLLESLRVDFVGNRQHISRLRELIQQSSVKDDTAVSVLLSMLGMNINDAAVLPDQLSSLDRTGQQLDQLFELMVDGLYAMREAPVEELASAIGELLPELQASRERVVVSGYLVTSNCQILAGGIKRLLATRTAEDRKAIEDQLAKQTQQLVIDSKPTTESLLQWIRDCDAAGLSRVAQDLMDELNLRFAASESSSESLAAQTRISRELLLLKSVISGSTTASDALVSLLESWKSTGRFASIRTLVSDLQATDGTNPEALLKLHTADGKTILASANDWISENPDFKMFEPSVWQGQPVISASDERTMLPAGQPVLNGPQLVIPHFGTPGLFRAWTFLQEAGQTEIIAVDGEGRRQWTFDSDSRISPQNTGLISDRYVMAYGHLVVLKLFQMMYVLDTSQATPERSPTLLWSINVDSLHRDNDPNLVREFVPGWQRIPNYSPQPAGMFPCGPITAEALPVISGRRLTVFDVVTGQHKWQLHGLAEDARLLATETELLILSEASRQIEQRNLTDGQLLGVARLPEWWMDANESVGSSVRDIEVEPGQNLYWRIAVFGRCCVLFHLGFTKSTIECRDVISDQVIWSVDLPQDSVFSNVAEDMVAILCEGKVLKLFRLDTGSELTSLEVTPVPEPRELYFRPHRDHFVVLPEAVEDPSLDLDPVTEGLHVYGRMYGVHRESMSLAWDQPLEHLFIRTLRAFPGPIIPNAPVMVLLSRYRIIRDDTIAFSSRYAARVIDVATGKQIDLGQEQKDVGRTLNHHWMTVDPDRLEVVLSFENRIFTLKYGTAE